MSDIQEMKIAMIKTLSVMTNIKRETLCIVIGSTELFGAERRFLKIIGSLTAKTLQFDLILAVNSSLYVKAQGATAAKCLLDQLNDRDGLIVVPDRLTHLWLSKRLWKLVRLLVSDAHFHLVLRGRVLSYLRALFGRKATIEVTSPDIAQTIGERMPLIVLRRVSSFLCVSPNVQRTLIASVARRDPDALQPCQVVTASTPYYEEPATTIGTKDRIIVCACRFIPRKNVIMFAKSVALATSRLPGWQFQILGRGPDEQEVRHVLTPQIAEGSVTIGYTADIATILSRSMIFVSLIEPDNYPSQSVLEAMGYGNALLLSDTGDSARFLDEHAPNGQLTSLVPTAIAESLVTMCQDEIALAEMGQRSQALVRSRFSADAYIERLLKHHGILGTAEPKTRLSDQEHPRYASTSSK